MTEVYKIVNGVAPPIMNSLFQFRCNTHNIKNIQEIFAENRKTVKYGTETVTYQAPCSGRIYALSMKTLGPLIYLNRK